jgi:predicted metal-dependent hydrolase
MRQGRAAAPSSLEHSVIEAVGAPVEVRRHPGARRMTLRISRTRRAVIVTLPMQCDIGEATPFIHRHIDWVRERLGSLPEPAPFRHGSVMPLRGVPHRLVFASRPAGDGGVVTMSHPNGGREAAGYGTIDVSGGPEQAPRRLLSWLCDEAMKDLDDRVLWHARSLGVRPKRIAVRDQTSRWGSCSTTGLLSFSWRLVLAPPLVLDYVAAHEVAHLAEMNHGPKFWALVRKTMPRMNEAKDWLQVYGMDLHRFGTMAKA